MDKKRMLYTTMGFGILLVVIMILLAWGGRRQSGGITLPESHVRQVLFCTLLNHGAEMDGVDQLHILYFCPTENNRENLRKEGVTEGVFVTGNTVIDALKTTVCR